MRLMVSGATTTIRKLAESHGDVLGCLVTPFTGNAPDAVAALGLPIAADNGCFRCLDGRRFKSMLGRYRDAGVPLEWVAVPDVVSDGVATLQLWHQWEPVITACGFRPALVLQDGMHLEDVIAISPPAVFVGGSTAWKLGSVARQCVEWARETGKPAHMGRVNTRRRMRYAIEIGCTSCDGSGFSQWADKRIGLGVKWINQGLRRMRAPTLF